MLRAAESTTNARMKEQEMSSDFSMESSGGCPAGGFGRRSVLGIAAGGLAVVGGNLLGNGNRPGKGARTNGVAVETAATFRLSAESAGMIWYR